VSVTSCPRSEGESRPLSGQPKRTTYTESLHQLPISHELTAQHGEAFEAIGNRSQLHPTSPTPEESQTSERAKGEGEGGAQTLNKLRALLNT
jgi:hypothetical protein